MKARVAATTEDRPGLVWSILKERGSVPVDSRVVMQVLADQFRSDLLRNGIGDGSHAFQARLPDVSVAGAVTMRRSVDRAPLRLSPDAAEKVVAPAGRLAA